jgi:hypothetical protein
MSDILLGQYDLIKAKIAGLKAEDIMNDPQKLELLKKLEDTIEKLDKLYSMTNEEWQRDHDLSKY